MTLKYNELQDLVLPKLSIDEFSPKTGDNKDVMVLGFYVKDKEPAKDLSHFIENGAYDILDVESSPASNDDGEYMVFVEFITWKFGIQSRWSWMDRRRFYTKDFPRIIKRTHKSRDNK